jgi:hypothetical protein
MKATKQDAILRRYVLSNCGTSVRVQCVHATKPLLTAAGIYNPKAFAFYDIKVKTIFPNLLVLKNYQTSRTLPPRPRDRTEPQPAPAENVLGAVDSLRSENEEAEWLREPGEKTSPVVGESSLRVQGGGSKSVTTVQAPAAGADLQREFLFPVANPDERLKITAVIVADQSLPAPLELPDFEVERAATNQEIEDAFARIFAITARTPVERFEQ